jgi:hypothetical protein
MDLGRSLWKYKLDWSGSRQRPVSGSCDEWWALGSLRTTNNCQTKILFPGARWMLVLRLWTVRSWRLLRQQCCNVEKPFRHITDYNFNARPALKQVLKQDFSILSSAWHIRVAHTWTNGNLQNLLQTHYLFHEDWSSQNTRSYRSFIHEPTYIPSEYLFLMQLYIFKTVCHSILLRTCPLVHFTKL